MLSYEQVNRLSELMNEVVPIHGRGNFPTLEVKLCDLVSLVRTKLELDNISVKEIRSELQRRFFEDLDLVKNLI